MRPGANRRDHVAHAGNHAVGVVASMRSGANRRDHRNSYLWCRRTCRCFNEARRESPGSRTRYRMPHHKQLRSTLRALAERPRCNT